MTLEVKGSQFGVRFEHRGLDDPHVCVVLVSEDDEHWHEVDRFSSYWIDDLIETLQSAKAVLESGVGFAPHIVDDPPGFIGYRFKEKK